MKRVLGAALAAALLSACAGLSAPGATKTETPQQSLATTGKAMGQLKSAKFDVAGTVQVTLPQSLARDAVIAGPPRHREVDHGGHRLERDTERCHRRALPGRARPGQTFRADLRGPCIE